MNTPPALSHPGEYSPIGRTSAHWFARGLLAGVMILAAANGASYFFRTPGMADLIGNEPHVTEAIGFPFEIWREDTYYHGTFFIDYVLAGVNLLVGVGLGTCLGILCMRFSATFNRWLDEFELDSIQRSHQNFQFSVKNMLWLTTFAAMFIAALTRWKGTPEVMVAIYFLGPLVLILIAMLPQKIHWQHRVVILSVTAVLMIGIAIWSGAIIGIPVDRILLGIFVSWPPQSALAALIITLASVIKLAYSQPASCKNDGAFACQPPEDHSGIS